MFKSIRATIIATAILAAAGAAHAASDQRAEYGMAAGTALADRVITVDTDTKWVNVNNGDTVAFNVNGKTFTWHFSTLRNESQLKLMNIAPEGVDTGKVVVYVGSNPLYRG